MTNFLTGQLKGILKSKSVENGLWLYGLQFFNTIIPLFTLPYITRILGTTQYGVFSILLNLSMYLQVVIEYGFALSATREVAILPKNENLSKLFSKVLCSRMFLYVVSMIIALLYCLFSDKNANEKFCLIILSASLIAYVFQENWLFQGRQDMKFISLTTMIARIITTILIFVFVKSADDLLLYCVLYSLSPILSNGLGTVIAVRKYKLRIISIRFRDIVDSLKSGMYIFFTQLSSKVFGAIGITFMDYFVNESEVGIYSAIYKIPSMLLLLWSPIAQVIYPVVSKKIVNSFNDGYRYVKKLQCFFVLIFSLIAIAISLISKPMISIAFGSEYSEQFYIIFPMLLWCVVSINNNFLGIQILVGSGHDKLYSKCFQIGVIATIVLNYIFIWIMGVWGASIAPLVSEAFLGILLLICVNNLKKAQLTT